MKHQPAESHVRIAQAVHKFLGVLECILLDQLALNDVLVKLEYSLVQYVVVFCGQSLDLVGHYVIAKCLGGSGEVLPPVLSQID